MTHRASLIGLIQLGAICASVLFVDPCPAAESAGPASPGRSPLPPAVDLRPVFTNWNLALRLQGDRGTCSVFTMVGAFEYALASRRPPGEALSVEFLNWASNQATRNHADGGFFSDLWRGFERYGICLESDQPYQAVFNPGLSPAEDVVARARERGEAGLKFHWIKPWNVETGLAEAEFLEIQRTLHRQWPVCGGFRWPKHERWVDHVLQMASPTEVFDGHSVLLVGYRDDPALPGGGVFLIRNSGRGDHDAAMSYEYVRAYMNDAAWIEGRTDKGGAGN